MAAEKAELTELVLGRRDDEPLQVIPFIDLPQILQFSVVSQQLQAAAAVQPPVIATNSGGTGAKCSGRSLSVCAGQLS